MKYRHLAMQDYHTMPWKNGLGSTLQMLISPEHSSVSENNFEWRITSAQVPLQSQFSLFPGYDRFLVLVEGDKIILSQKTSTTSLKVGQVFQFSGEETIRCETSCEKTTDLNLFFDRTKLRANVLVLRGSNAHQLSGTKKNFIIALNGPTTLTFQDGTTLQLKHLDCCQFYEEFEDISVSATTQDLYVLAWIENKS